MPTRVWQLGPLRYALPARAVADTVRDLASLRDVRAIVADAVQRGRCRVPDLSHGTRRGPEPRVGAVPRGAGRRRRRDPVGRGRGPQGPARASPACRCRCSTPSHLRRRGTFIARPDAWWPGVGVAVEVDSREWHMSPEDHARTLERQRRMGKHGIIVLPLHAQADPHPAGESHRRRSATPSKRPRPPAGEPADRPARREAQPSRNAPKQARRQQHAEAALTSPRTGSAAPRWSR